MNERSCTDEALHSIQVHVLAKIGFQLPTTSSHATVPIAKANLNFRHSCIHQQDHLFHLPLRIFRLGVMKLDVSVLSREVGYRSFIRQVFINNFGS